ncbi:MAG: DUF1919 domain-containing protein [Selenomonadaceae bacterium]|nr:DUF1919 domain-containing protein [Selenomonadaceae bacterium]
MLRLTNNTKDFIENHQSPIIVYSAGNAGYWTGVFLKKCSVDFLGFLDKSVTKEPVYYDGKLLYHPGKLWEFRHQALRIILPLTQYNEVITELLFSAQKYDLDLLCLVPRYRRITENNKTMHYNINVMFGYFREKLLKYPQGKPPTILSNTCSAGYMYKALGLPLSSPTINVGINSLDFVNLCKNLKHYMEIPMEKMYFARVFPMPNNGAVYCPAGKIDDAEILFAHETDLEKAKNSWNILRENLNYDDVTCIFSDRFGAISPDVMKDFSNLPMRKIFLYYQRPPVFIDKDILVENGNAIHDIYTVLENTFDILGFFNKPFNEVVHEQNII